MSVKIAPGVSLVSDGEAFSITYANGTSSLVKLLMLMRLSSAIHHELDLAGKEFALTQGVVPHTGWLPDPKPK